MKREIFKAKDGKEISVAVWDDVKNPKAVVQISHGMAEHIARYDDFAKFLNANRYIVFGDDHRAHGLTDREGLGLAYGDLFADTVSDLIELTDWAKARWEMPVVLFGHSYGSFLAQEYLITASGNILGCVLSGSALYGGGTVTFGKLVAKLKGKRNKDKPGKFFANITFKSYDKKIGEGLNGWLSHDAESNKKYNDDEMCGFTCSNGFYSSFFAGLKRVSHNDFKSVRNDLPLMIIYGTEDRVGGRGKLVEKLAARYRSAGLTPAVRACDGSRHEILNETNKQDVYEEVLNFLASFV